MRKDGIVWKELLHENLRWPRTESRAIALSESTDDPVRTGKNWPESRKEKRKTDGHKDCGSKVKFTEEWSLSRKQINIELKAIETFADQFQGVLWMEFKFLERKN